MKGIKSIYWYRFIEKLDFSSKIEPGAVIREILNGSPAEKGGLQIDDIILKINETIIKKWRC